MSSSSLFCDIGEDVELEALTSFIWRNSVMIIRVKMKTVDLNQYMRYIKCI